MSEPICIRCERPIADGAYACDRCAASAGRSLAEIAETTSAARDVANGLSRRSQSGGSGKPGSRLPLDLTATAKLDAVQNELTGWARAVAEERGVPAWDGTEDPDYLIRAARYLGAHLEWMRHRDFVDEFLTDVDAAVRVMRGLVRGPQEQRYLGPCGAPVSAIDQIIDQYGADPAVGLVAKHCDGDVYGRAGADKGTCRTCGAQVDQGERLIWLDDVRRDWLFTAREIAEAYPINVKTIRSWYDRGLLAGHGEHEGTALLKLGEVLDLAAGDAARREEARATRARRKEQAA